MPCWDTKHKESDKERKGKEQVVMIIPVEDNEKDEEHEGINNMFCFAALADKKNGTFYTDATGAFPQRSIDGHQYYFVAYDYDTNYIFAEPIKDVTDASIIEAFKKIFEELKFKGYKPTFNVTNNQATVHIKEYLKSKDCDWQFVEPTNH